MLGTNVQVVSLFRSLLSPKVPFHLRGMFGQLVNSSLIKSIYPRKQEHRLVLVATSVKIVLMHRARVQGRKRPFPRRNSSAKLHRVIALCEFALSRTFDAARLYDGYALS